MKVQKENLPDKKTMKTEKNVIYTMRQWWKEHWWRKEGEERSLENEGSYPYMAETNIIIIEIYK